ncbi:Cro/CI family transcriptional regulator [Acinetobacter thermotolerans]|uniref:Cro/CI family transcriptional regulator n=1 Tax=Acinetobacter thermotolerans TaxID=3151487 RepID=UPI00325A708E
MKVLIKTSDAIEHFKNASHLADEIGITPQAVNQWGEYVPDPSVGKIMALVPTISYKIVRSQKEPTALLTA